MPSVRLAHLCTVLGDRGSKLLAATYRALLLMVL
eukprot:COSAG02_NODE_52_length_44175_cov_97.989654_19_plen_34_part_00